jgi:hypothetical protein
MQQRLGLGHLVEVTGFSPKHKIRNEARAGGSMFAEPFILAGQQKKPTIRQDNQENDDQSGKDPFASPRIKVKKLKLP